MIKVILPITILLLIPWWPAVLATTHSYRFGRNTARVVTGSHKTCSGRNIEVTHSVSAVLHEKRNGRSDFKGSKFTRRMDEMDKRPGDHKGHIMASMFGGPAEIWNMAPQADNVNTRINKKNSILNSWWECETYIKQELESGAHLPIRATMKLTYGSGSARPTHWYIEAHSSNHEDPGCQTNNVQNGYGGSFACSTRKSPTKKTKKPKRPRIG